MGCTHCSKTQEPVIINPNQNGFKSLFYATTEFDLSRSDSEDEEENYSLNSMKGNKSYKNKNTSSSLNVLNSTSNISSTTVNSSTLNNQIGQAGV